jgi:hypothetical protein
MRRGDEVGVEVGRIEVGVVAILTEQVAQVPACVALRGALLVALGARRLVLVETLGALFVVSEVDTEGLLGQAVVLDLVLSGNVLRARGVRTEALARCFASVARRQQYRRGEAQGQ